jgi:hypothetical protein
MDMEPESFRGGGGEAIGSGHTAGEANDPTLGFTGTSGACADRSSLYCLFISIFKFLLVAVALTLLLVFLVGFVPSRSVNAGLNKVRNIFGN